MHRDLRIHPAWPALAGLLLFAGALPAPAQQSRTARIDVEQYTIEAEVTPERSALAVKAAVRFLPVDDGISSATFELNNALNVSRVVDGQGKLMANRFFSIKLSMSPINWSGVARIGSWINP